MEPRDVLLAAPPASWTANDDESATLDALVAVIRAVARIERHRQRAVLIAAASYLELPGAWNLYDLEQEQLNDRRAKPAGAPGCPTTP